MFSSTRRTFIKPGRLIVPEFGKMPKLLDGTGTVGKAAEPGSIVTTAVPGGFWMTLNVTFPKLRSYDIPYPPRTLVLPLPNTSHANPTRGAKLFLSGFQSAPTGLS